MKKRLILTGVIVFSIVLMIAVFVKSNQVRNGHNTETIKIEVSNITNDGADAQSYWNPDNHAVAKGMNGYYYLSETNGIYRIMFFDENAQEAIPVCGKPECTHQDHTCNAYIMDMRQLSVENFLAQTLYYHEGYLYGIKCESGMTKLVRMNLDGSERKMIGDLFANSGISSISLVFHEKYVYAYDDTGHNGQTTEAEETIKKISLEDGTSEVAFSYKGVGASIDRGRSFGGKMYFVVREYEYHKETHMQKTDYKGLFAYDYDSGEVKKVIEAEICDYYVDTENQEIYYFVEGKGLYRYAVPNDRNDLIYAAHNQMITCRMSYDGQYIYLYNSGIGSLTDAAVIIKRCCYVLDRNGNEINRIPCHGMVYFGDKNYLFEENGNRVEYIDKEYITEAKEWSSLK